MKISRRAAIKVLGVLLVFVPFYKAKAKTIVKRTPIIVLDKNIQPTNCVFIFPPNEPHQTDTYTVLLTKLERDSDRSMRYDEVTLEWLQKHVGTTEFTIEDFPNLRKILEHPTYLK